MALVLRAVEAGNIMVMQSEVEEKLRSAEVEPEVEAQAHPAIATENTGKIHGHMFEGYGESLDKQQLTKTLEVLLGYINKTIDFTKDVASICKKLTQEEVKEPEELTYEEVKSPTKKLIWKTKVKTYARWVEAQEKNCQSIFAVIWGQCSITMKNKLQSLSDHESRSGSNDCVWLLKEIKATTLRFEEKLIFFVT